MFESKFRGLGFLAALVVSVSACGSGGNPSTSAACAQLMCNEHQVCDSSTTPARCKCQDAYTGTSCSSCARGYTSMNGTCLPMQINCELNPGVCGVRGTCVRGAGVLGDACSCQPGYEGNACASCSPGYQMSGSTCRPTCATAMLTCTAPKICSDATGAAACACPGNRIGTNCDQCPSGYVLRASDGTCVQTCSSIATCGAHKRCDDSGGTPICVCADPWTGDSCNTCAAGYMPDGAGNCVRAAPAGTTLIAGGRFQGTEYLIALNPHANPPSATPMRPLSGLSNQRLATDVMVRTIYTVSANSISRLDPVTGQPTPVASNLPSLQSACFGQGALYTIGSISPYLLTRVDPATAARTDLGSTTLVGGQGMVGLAWDRMGSLLYARPPTSSMQTNGADLYLVDPATGSPTMIGPMAMEANRLRPQDTRMSLAVDAGGHAFLATRVGRLPDDVVKDHCRKMAAGLGYAGYEAAPFTSLEILQGGIGAGVTRVLTSREGGPEIVAYASYGQRLAAKSMVRIETSNPQAFVCISTYEEVLELQIPGATAQFAAIGLSGYRPTFGLAVEGSLPAVTKPTLHVHQTSGTPPPAFSAYSFSKVYTSTEWSKLALPVYASAWTTDIAAPVVLIELDLTTRTPKRQLTFPQIELFPSIAPWTP